MSRSRVAAMLLAGLLLGCGDDDGGGGECQPSSADGPWSRSDEGVGGAVTFNEIMFHPTGADLVEWIELFNPMAIDVDLSGWRIAGAVELAFPEGSRIAPRGFAVVASSSAFPGTIATFTGNLPDAGGRIELQNNSGRLLDAVTYADGDPWPASPAGSGVSLTKRAPETASEPPEAWAGSADMGGTPGAANVPADAVPSGLAFNELAGACDDEFWLELTNLGAEAVELDGHIIVSTSGAEHELPPRSLAPGVLVAVTANDLGFDPVAGDTLFLEPPDRGAVLDAARVQDAPRGRRSSDNAWRYPDVSTPGAPNSIAEHDEIVIDEVFYHAPPVTLPDGTVEESSLEWIELTNRSADPVDVGGYQLVDAVAAALPDGLVMPPGGTVVVASDVDDMEAAYPDLSAPVVPILRGTLGNSGDRIVLRDARGNPVDEVAYGDGAPWPAFADGGGSSLELRDLDADNAAPEAWTASDETASTPWQTISYEGVAAPSSVGPDGQWQELVVGLLDAGVVLVDDLSVVVDPAGAATELVTGGDFEAGAASMRMLGNHRHGEVIQDPDSPGNHVLRLVATGQTEHMHNHLETTLAGGHQITNGLTYRISLRARWQAGSNLLDTRLYFERLARTTSLPVPARPGTPGAANRAAEANIGPTYRDLRNRPVVPEPGEPVEISVLAADPDGVAGMTLHYAVDGGAPASAPMSDDGDGRWTATVPGGPAASVVQFHVEAEDGEGARSTYPAAGPESRALFRVDDGLADTGGLHVVRILMTPADVAWLFDPPNLMSNDLVGATVIYDERKVYHDVGVRLKSSERGRPSAARVGFALRFPSTQPFRGVHRSVLIDRSQGVGYGQRELFFFQAMNHAGSVSSQYDDLIQVLPPLAEHAGPAHLQLARFGELFLDTQFDHGSDGALFEYELIYYPTTTDDGTPTGRKLPDPDSVVGTPITGLGDDEESYRLPFIPKNNRWRDDFRGFIHFAQVFGQTGAAFDAQVGDVIAVNQWLRAFAIATLSGAIDNYASGAQHNADLFVRPGDHRVLFFPHDMDFLGSAHGAIVASPDLAKLIATPARARAYYGHLHDIIATSYNGTYMQPWSAQFGALLPGQDFAAQLAYIVDRADWVLTTAPDAIVKIIPPVPFAITTGDPLTVTTATIDLDGSGWIDVHHVKSSGAPGPTLSWPGTSSWHATLAVPCGTTTVQLDAFDRHDQPVGSDSLTVTRTAPDCP